ncbi:MAG TPA: PilZ domain-containing protein [Rudaea sp.]|nr:PilZ domain-containing protein [Rudaea sp.]
MAEHRRNQRKRARHAIAVSDAISGRGLGHVGNLSINGMLLISSRKLPENALFQVNFELPNGATAKSHTLEIGLHEQWCEAANMPGQFWTGFRIIDIGPDDYNILFDWVNSPGGQFD